jgi:hypothetical protein
MTPRLQEGEEFYKRSGAQAPLFFGAAGMIGKVSGNECGL